MKKYKYILLINIFISALFSQYGKNIVQYENFDWHFIQTKNFDVHYHNGIRDIALSGASMAEQIRPVLMKQMGLKDLPK